MTPDDYRDSHLDRGSTYDHTLGSTPLDAYMNRWEAHHLARVLPKLFPSGIARYLDFACGTGRITQHVAPRCCESYGVDVSESMLNVARSKCERTHFTCIDLTNADWAQQSFDLVTSFRFFGNAQDELRQSALRAIYRRLKPGGYLVVNNHRNPNALMSRGAASRREQIDLSSAKFARLLSDAGFDIVNRRAIGFWIFRHRLTQAVYLESRVAQLFERWFQSSLFASLSPDAIIVARKRSLDELP